MEYNQPGYGGCKEPSRVYASDWLDRSGRLSISLGGTHCHSPSKEKRKEFKESFEVFPNPCVYWSAMEHIKRMKMIDKVFAAVTALIVVLVGCSILFFM